MEKAHQLKKRNRVFLSCTECHRRKQKCNRQNPCNDCLARGLPQRCKYMAPPKPPPTSRLSRTISEHQVTLTAESVDALANQNLVSDASFTDSADTELSFRPVIIDEINIENIENMSELSSPNSDFLTTLWPSYYPRRPNSPNVSSGLRSDLDLASLGGSNPFPCLPSDDVLDPVLTRTLLHYYVVRLGPWLSHLDDAVIEGAPRLAWLPYAMNNVPLFYATLLTAAVHLNRRQPMNDPSYLLNLKVQTINMANKNIETPCEAVSDEMIIVALILLYFNVTGDDPVEFEVHLKGINQMIICRGGQKNLGMNGIPKNWLRVCYGPWKHDWEDGIFLKR